MTILWCVKGYEFTQKELADGRKVDYKDLVVLGKHLSFQDAKKLVRENRNKKADIFPDIEYTQAELDIEKNKIEIVVPKANLE
jgi:hypothetical protein